MSGVVFDLVIARFKLDVLLVARLASFGRQTCPLNEEPTATEVKKERKNRRKIDHRLPLSKFDCVTEVWVFQETSLCYDFIDMEAHKTDLDDIYEGFNT